MRKIIIVREIISTLQNGLFLSDDDHINFMICDVMIVDYNLKVINRELKLPYSYIRDFEFNKIVSYDDINKKLYLLDIDECEKIASSVTGRIIDKSYYKEFLNYYEKLKRNTKINDIING